MIRFEKMRMLAAGVLLLFLIAGFLFDWNAHPLFLLFGILYLLLCGQAIARSLFLLSRIDALLFAPLSVAVPLCIGGAVIYFFYKIDVFSVLFLLCLPLICAWCAHVFCVQKKHEESSAHSISFTRIQGVLCAVFLLSFAFFWYVLFHSQTTSAALGPWTTLRHPIFIPYFLGTLALLGMILSDTRRTLSLLSLCVWFLSSFSVLLVIFPLGFGFDPHLHQATERSIAENGFVLPKQLYYLGQYALIAFLSKLFAISADGIDRVFLPFLSAASIPVAALLCAYAYRLSEKSSLLFALFALSMPFGFAIFTVPWNITILLALIFSYVSIAYIRSKYKGMLIALFFLAGAATSIHPLSGLILFGIFFCIFSHTAFSGYAKKEYILAGIAVLFSGSIPLAFWINSLYSLQLQIAFTPRAFEGVLRFFDMFSFHADTRFSAPLDFIHVIYGNDGIILLILAASGMLCAMWRSFFSWKQAFFPLLATGICVINYLLIETFLAFPSLISYEQHAYADRMLSLAVFFLIPPASYALVMGFQKICRHPSPIFRAIWLIFSAGMLTGSLYLSYPSNDVYRSFHGYTISQADIIAARVIQNHAAGEPYIVLSNQVVAAAAVKEFGFQKYFDINDHGIVRQYFYYPIPTSSPLYAYFLEMQRYPNQETVRRAMRLFDVRQVYFVVTRYEDRYEKITEQARAFADFSKNIGNGADVVFGYTE